MKKLFSRVYWFVLVPIWLVFGIAPFFAIMFGVDFVFGHDELRTGYWLYSCIHMSVVTANEYFIVILGSAFFMKVFWFLEWLHYKQLALLQKHQSARKS